MSVFKTTATATRPVNGAGRECETMLGYQMRETAGAAARARIFSGAFLAPGACAGADDAAAGDITIGNHTLKVTYVTEDGETDLGTASASIACAGGKKLAASSIPVYSGPNAMRVTGRKLYLNTAGRNEIQTLTLKAGATADTFKLTYDGVESSAVTLPAPDFTGTTLAQIQAAIDSIPALVGKATATGATGGPFAITFTGTLADTDVPAITVTSKTGAADGSVAETLKGVAQGAAWYLVSTLSDNTTTTSLPNVSDAALVALPAAPTANLSGVLCADRNLAANECVHENFPRGIAGGLLRVEIVSGAVQTLIYGT